MPQFEMPPAAGARASLDAAAPDDARPAHVTEPDASDLTPLPRAGRGWRQLLTGLIVGAVVGAATPGAAQLADRAADAAEVEQLRTLALDYLAAIADGRASDATAMVPLPEPAEVAPDAMLQAAERIEDVAVRVVHVDGDVASIAVRYSVVGAEVTRALEAERAGGTWRLTTSLAEPLRIARAHAGLDVRVAGVTLRADRDVHLYPGSYPIEPHDGALLRTTGEPIVVDGDPRAQQETVIATELAPTMSAHATEVALAVARMCLAGRSCVLPPQSQLTPGAVHVYEIHDAGVDLRVQLMTGREADGHWYESLMTVVTDERGAPTRWLCSPIGISAPPDQTCPAAP